MLDIHSIGYILIKLFPLVLRLMFFRYLSSGLKYLASTEIDTSMCSLRDNYIIIMVLNLTFNQDI
jgi:hypothetical protein